MRYPLTRPTTKQTTDLTNKQEKEKKITKPPDTTQTQSQTLLTNVDLGKYTDSARHSKTGDNFTEK